MVERKKYTWRHPSGREYFRRGKSLIRINAEIGTEAYDRLYWEIMTGKRAEAKRSWGALIELFRQSDKWSSHSPRYRQDLEPVFSYLIEKIGKADVSRLTQTDIYKAMDANTHRIRFANYIPTAISMLSKFAIRKAWRTTNPAIGIEPLKVPTTKKKPHIPWPDWAVERFRAEANPIARLIFEIGVGTLQRPGDWIGFTWGDYDGDTLKLRQNKTGIELTLPCTPALKAALNEAKAALDFAPMPNRHILTNAYGGRMIYRTMADNMIKERKRLGLMLYDQHALRYRGVKELAWSGCDDDEIASYSGHTTKAMIVKYAGEARQIMRARQAAAKRF
ncbi:integrase (plasmid) [Pseudorhodobacter turbinis]|uniref:Integrase n=1 Tax=Pseudorhodobacter turbinis TaxID=2500533 RepID=A0A4P8EJD1_9RHOB|nr:tyrosine-type recombinase/integrase [Pseudorhodobacter turbinis]QCO56952.1 integrase [Pseudorhodobacter turbinis]